MRTSIKNIINDGLFCKQTSDIKNPDNSSLTMFFNKFTKVQKIADFWGNLEIWSVSILNFEHHEKIFHYNTEFDGRSTKW